jgi:segregation and condensation protein B
MSKSDKKSKKDNVETSSSTAVSQAVDNAIGAIEWNNDSDALEFTESVTPDQAEMFARFEDMARRVANTVAKRDGVADEINDQGPVDADDADPAASEFVESDQLISIVESLLFSSDKPVSVATIKMLFKGTTVRTKDIGRALDILASDYAARVRGVTLEEINGGYQLRTKVDNTEFLKRLAKVRPFRLSGPALEVMAIVAYKQPVSKHEIDEIRGVESGHLVRALMERGMVSFVGKSETLPGKPMTYGTTRKFLETFGLRNIRELPSLGEIDELLPEGIGDVEETESLSDLTEQLSQDLVTSYSEGEEELSKIQNTLSAIDTSSEFFEQEKQRERDRRDHDRAQDIRERMMMNEEIEAKDKRWLDKYDLKIVHANSAQADAVVQDVSIVADLAALSAEPNAVFKHADADEQSQAEAVLLAEEQDFDEDIGLVENANWDEDIESDKNV